MKQPQPHPPHTRGTFHCRRQHLCTEKHKVSFSGFLPKTKPMQHSCSHYNAFCSITWLTRMYLCTWQQSMKTIMLPFQCDLQPELQKTHKTTQTGTTTHCRTQRRNQFAHETTPAAPAAHTKYISSPAAATLHEKTESFVLPLPPQNKAHATFMQPLQCVLQHHVAYPHVSTHMATEHDNIWQQSCSHSNAICNQSFKKRRKLRKQEQLLVAEHRGTNSRIFAHETTPAAPAAHTKYISSPAAATLHEKTESFVLPLPPQNKAHATFMQPLQCVLQHHVDYPHVSTHMATEHDNIWQQSCSHSNAICNQSFKKRIKLRKQEQPLIAEHRGGTNSRMKRPQPHSPRTRNTFHRRMQPLCTEKHKVSCSGSLPKTKPMQHSCSHYNAFCSITWLARMYLCTWQQSMKTIMQPFQGDLQAELQETNAAHRNNYSLQNTEEPIRTWNDPSRTRHTHEVIHRQLQPLCTEKRKVSCSGSLPKTKPMQHSCSHYNAFCSITWLTRMYLRTWQHQMTTYDNNHAAITRVYCYVMSSLTPQSHTALHRVYSYVM